MEDKAANLWASSAGAQLRTFTAEAATLWLAEPNRVKMVKFMDPCPYPAELSWDALIQTCLDQNARVTWATVVLFRASSKPDNANLLFYFILHPR